MAIHKSTGNIFKDLGFDEPEALNLRLRSLLMAKITEWIRSRELTQQEAADVLDVTQSRISDLMTGKIHKFTVDNLLYLFTSIGWSLEPKETKTGTTLKFINSSNITKSENA